MGLLVYPPQEVNGVGMDNPRLPHILPQMQTLCLPQLCLPLDGQWPVQSRNMHNNNFRHQVLVSQLWNTQLCKLLSECLIVLLAPGIHPSLCGLKTLVNLLTGEGRGREHNIPT